MKIRKGRRGKGRYERIERGRRKRLGEEHTAAREGKEREKKKATAKEEAMEKLMANRHAALWSIYV